MKQRFGVLVGLMAAFLVAMFGLTAVASAADGANSSASEAQLTAKVKKAQKRVNKAVKKQKATCKKVRKAKGKAKRKARKRCSTTKKQTRAARRALAKAKGALKKEQARYFDVCKHGCKYRTVQNGANAAGTWQFKTKRHDAVVRVQPGTYVEGVFVYTEKTKLKRDFDGMTIMGVTKAKKPLKDARQVLLEGTNAKTIVKGNDPFWQEGDDATKPAQNAIEARNVKNFKMKNMWGQHYKNNVWFVWASTNPAYGERCEDYTMDNLLANDTRAYGLFARNCFGGLMENSKAWNTGDSGFYIGETPCDDPLWNNRGSNPKPCQANPKWAVLDNVEAFQNTLGYSGTNSKYVEIKNSAWYNNGAGIVPNTLDSEKFEPAGWMKIHDNDVFWNNYNYYCTGVAPATCGGTSFHTVSGGLGELLGAPVNFPTGVGVMLFGNDGIEVYDNNIFGNEKWGAAAFSAPVFQPFDVVANVDDDGKNLNNHFTGNKMGRDGVDPNGTDFMTDNTGGGNCWSGNVASGGVTYVLGAKFGSPGTKTQAQLYPSCEPKPPRAFNKNTSSFDITQGIQVEVDGDLNVVMNPDTVLGYAGQNPPDQQECSWHTPVTPTGPNQFHPAFPGYTEKRTDPAVCGP